MNIRKTKKTTLTVYEDQVKKLKLAGVKNISSYIRNLIDKDLSE
jgi:hypothetical protein